MCMSAQTSFYCIGGKVKLLRFFHSFYLSHDSHKLVRATCIIAAPCLMSVDVCDIKLWRNFSWFLIGDKIHGGYTSLV